MYVNGTTLETTTFDFDGFIPYNFNSRLNLYVVLSEAVDANSQTTNQTECLTFVPSRITFVYNVRLFLVIIKLYLLKLLWIFGGGIIYNFHGKTLFFLKNKFII